MKRWLAATAGAVMVVISVAGVAHATDDPEWQSQYGPTQIHAPEAWSVTRGADVVIAIVDTGVQLDHPDLRDKIVPGYDFYDDDDDPSDENGHGTHVAGIAAAITDNGLGIAGVAPHAKILPVRVLGPEGAGSGEVTQFLLSLQQAVGYAVDQGAKVINLSLGESEKLGPAGFDRLSTACRDAFSRGSLCVAAAGNDGRGKPSGYANDFQGIVVAANDRDAAIADFSQNADTQWSVTAPGVAIDSTWIGSSYAFEQGTSMAAPHVAGVAALLFAQGLGIQDVVDRITSTATPLNDGGGSSGSGLINAAAAVGAPFEASAPPAAAPTATTAAPAAGAPRPGVATTVAGAGPAPTVVLDEGTIDDNEFGTGSSSDFEEAIDLGDVAEPISQSEGFTLAYTLEIAAFVVLLGLIGVGLRRMVIRRDVGAIHNN